MLGHQKGCLEIVNWVVSYLSYPSYPSYPPFLLTTKLTLIEIEYYQCCRSSRLVNGAVKPLTAMRQDMRLIQRAGVCIATCNWDSKARDTQRSLTNEAKEKAVDVEGNMRAKARNITVEDVLAGGKHALYPFSPRPVCICGTASNCQGDVMVQDCFLPQRKSSYDTSCLSV